MIKPDKKTIWVMALAAVLLMTAYAMRIIPNEIWRGGNIYFPYIRAAIHLGIIALWGLSVQHRVIHPQVRGLFRAISALMVFWFVIRTLKHMVFTSSVLVRYSWYLYYIPMLFIPLLSFFLAISLGRAENYRLPAWTRWLYPIAGILFLLVLTNDLHQMVFQFPENTFDFYRTVDDVYSYGILFYPVVGWRYAGLLVTIMTILERSRVPQSRKHLLLPMVFALILFLYGIGYMTGTPWIYRFCEDLTVMECLLVIAIFESCLRCGLIQSNSRYAELFHLLQAPALIADENSRIVCTSENYSQVPEAWMHSAENETVEFQDGLLLKSMPIRNGHIFWTEDITELKVLQSEVEQAAKALEEEKDLLQAEIEMKQKQAVVDTRNRLYDSLTRELAPQFAEIERLLSGAYADGEERRLAIRRMCVIGAFVKRRCNLLFLNEEYLEISSGELAHCLRESADYIRLYGAQCVLNEASSGMISTAHAKLAYDWFERVTETVLSGLIAMLIYLEVNESGLTLKIQSEGTAAEVDFSDMRARVDAKKGLLTDSYEDGVLYERLSLPKSLTIEGGDAP